VSGSRDSKYSLGKSRKTNAIAAIQGLCFTVTYLLTCLQYFLAVVTQRYAHIYTVVVKLVMVMRDLSVRIVTMMSQVRLPDIRFTDAFLIPLYRRGLYNCGITIIEG